MTEPRTDQELQTRPAEAQRMRTYLPEVDIYETEEAFVLTADLPGVDDKGVDVTVENGILTLEAQASLPLPEGVNAARREFDLARYQRTFNLSDRLDVNNISAGMKQGVLTLTLPKSEDVKPRKITISPEG